MITIPWVINTVLLINWFQLHNDLSLKVFSILDLMIKDDSNSKSTRRRIYQTLAKVHKAAISQKKILIFNFQTVFLEMTLLIAVVLTYYEDSDTIEIEASNGLDKSCWENSVGQEMYRLLLLFLAGLIFFTFIMESTYKIVQPW